MYFELLHGFPIKFPLLQEENDDDLWRWSQVQGLNGLLHTGANPIMLLVLQVLHVVNFCRC